MGDAKPDRYDQDDRGYSFIDGFICSAHVIDQALLGTLEQAPFTACCACGRTDQTGVALDALAGRVKEAIDYFWEPGFYGHDYELDGQATSTQDVLANICSGAFTDEESDKIVGRIEEAIDEASEHSGWLHNRQFRLEWSWELFSHNVRYTNRFVFLPEGTGTSRNPATHSTAEFLHELTTYTHGDLNMVHRVEAGTSMFRGRLSGPGSTFDHNAKELGPAPAEKTSANRMSAVGVSLFYGSDDPQGAIAEIAGHGTDSTAIVAEFKTARALFILDLTRTPPNPGSVFDAEKRPAIAMRSFLTTFVANVTRPVIPDGREHVEYAPTQVMTEYIRFMSGTLVDGIALPSKPGKGTKTYVIFAGPKEVADEPGEAEHWLTLAPDAITTYDIERSYTGHARNAPPI